MLTRRENDNLRHGCPPQHTASGCRGDSLIPSQVCRNHKLCREPDKDNFPSGEYLSRLSPSPSFFINEPTEPFFVRRPLAQAILDVCAIIAVGILAGVTMGGAFLVLFVHF